MQAFFTTANASPNQKSSMPGYTSSLPEHDMLQLCKIKRKKVGRTQKRGESQRTGMLAKEKKT
jgi:hypothetical protein